MESARNVIRNTLHSQNPGTFSVTNNEGTDIYELCHRLLKQPVFYTQQRHCNKCNIILANVTDRAIYNDYLLVHCSKAIWKMAPRTMANPQGHSALDWLNAYIKQRTDHRCSTCNTKMINKLIFTDYPKFIAFHRDNVEVLWDTSIKWGEHIYKLSGLIYYGQFHFTARIIANDGEIWYHDGITTGRSCVTEGNIQSYDSIDLMTARDGKICILTIYTIST